MLSLNLNGYGEIAKTLVFSLFSQIGELYDRRPTKCEELHWGVVIS